MEEDKKEVLLTEDQVWDVIEFARNMNGFNGMQYLNPFLLSERMKDVTLNPVKATEAKLEQAMIAPKEHERELQAFSQDFELSSIVYKRLISYLANMLSFDITYVSTAKPEDYKTPKYKKDSELLESLLDRFDYKKEFRIAVKEMLRNDAFFGCMREAGDKFVLQELPSDYCKITGRWENGFLFSFNMYWFMLPGVDLDMYPKFFKKKYLEIFVKGTAGQVYNPSIMPEHRDQSSWVYWVDVPVDVGVCFKLTPELATRLPYFTPLFNDLVLQGLMRNLQKSMNMAAASKIIMGEVPLLNKETKATVKDSLAVTPDMLGKFMALIKSAISDAIKIASAPLQEIEAISFDTDNDMYDSYLRTALASSGINTNLIFSSSVKPNAIETQLSLNVDEQMMTSLYEQFDDFMEYFINSRTKHFKFYTAFEGTEFSVNRDSRLEKAMTLFNQGVVLPQKISAAIGMKPHHFRKQMEESQAFDFMSLLTPPSVEIQKRTIEMMPEPVPGEVGKTTPKVDSKSGETVKRGRPAKSTSELGEEGMKTKETASNVGRGGKV
jgi:hypothetical protein